MRSPAEPRTRNRGMMNTSRNTSMDTSKNRMVWMVIVILVLFTSMIVCSAVAEATARESWDRTWSSVGPFVKSGKYWVNSLIVFGLLTVLFILIWSKNVSGNGQKVMLYIVIAVFALMIATKFVVPNAEGGGARPEYIWHHDTVHGFIRFLIGPGEEEARDMGVQDTCGGRHSELRAWLSINPNPPCCGSGVYKIVRPGTSGNVRTGICKQAILRTNENGMGMPAFLVASIMFTLLFLAFKANLGIDKLGSSGSTWFPIALGVLLGALAANQRITKNGTIMIGGWIAVLLLGNKLSKSLSQDAEKKNTKKGFGFGLAFAFIELIANMLGSSLIGRTPEGGVSFGTILFNIVLGMAVGMLYSSFSGKGVFGKVKKRLDKQKEDEIEKLLDTGKWRDVAKAYMRALPLIGWVPWFRPRDLKNMTAADAKLQIEIDKWDRRLEKELDKPYHDKEFVKFCENKIEELRNKLAERAKKEGEGDEGKKEKKKPKGPGGPPA